jgi:hypothetical protein
MKYFWDKLSMAFGDTMWIPDFLDPGLYDGL